jgi:hypothetical protein
MNVVSCRSRAQRLVQPQQQHTRHNMSSCLSGTVPYACSSAITWLCLQTDRFGDCFGTVLQDTRALCTHGCSCLATALRHRHCFCVCTVPVSAWSGVHPSMVAACPCAAA